MKWFRHLLARLCLLSFCSYTWGVLGKRTQPLGYALWGGIKWSVLSSWAFPDSFPHFFSYRQYIQLILLPISFPLPTPWFIAVRILKFYLLEWPVLEGRHGTSAQDSALFSLLADGTVAKQTSPSQGEFLLNFAEILVYSSFSQIIYPIQKEFKPNK